MSVKFKVGFDIDGETLFTLLSKFLPVDNMTIEELRPEPQPKLPVEAIVHAVKHITKPKRKYKRASRGPDLANGINGIIVSLLADGMGHNPSEFRKPLEAAGYSESSVSSRMEALRSHGVVERIGQGWRLSDKHFIEASKEKNSGEEKKAL